MSISKIDFNHISSFGYYLLNSTMIRQYAPDYKKICKIHRDSFGWYAQFKNIDKRYNITLGVINKRKSFICIRDLKDNVHYLNNNAKEHIQSLINENILEDNNSSSSQELPKQYSLENNQVVNMAEFLNKNSDNVKQVNPFSNSVSNKIYNVKFLSDVFDVNEASWRLGLINIKPINEFFDGLTFEFNDIYVLCHGSEVHYNDNPPILKLNGNIIYKNGYGISALNNGVQFFTENESYIYLPKSISKGKSLPTNSFYRYHLYSTYKEAQEAIKNMQYEDFNNRKETVEKKLNKAHKEINKLEREREAYIKRTIIEYDKRITFNKNKYEKLVNELELLNCDFEKQRGEDVI